MPARPADTAAAFPARNGPYRLLVKAVDDPRRRRFVWEILPVDHGRPPFKRSSTSYRSMAEAYEGGTVALRLLNSTT